MYLDAEQHRNIRIPNNSVIVRTGTVFGQGLHGTVYEVAYRGSIIRAAKKYLHADRATLLQFFGEDKVLCNIQHENLVAYCGVGSLANDSPVVVMERMDMNLSFFLETRSLSLDCKFRVIYEVLQGLNHLHSLKPPIIHGGLNEKNVLISSKEVVKITDFGNSFLPAPVLPSAAKRPLLQYMPPEVMRREECNEKVDIFSLGHLAIYIMNQEKPHLILGPTFELQGRLIARSEVERRIHFLEKMKSELDGGDTHPLFVTVVRCLNDAPDSRPSCQTILQNDFFGARKLLLEHVNNNNSMKHIEGWLVCTSETYRWVPASAWGIYTCPLHCTLWMPSHVCAHVLCSLYIYRSFQLFLHFVLLNVAVYVSMHHGRIFLFPQLFMII